MRWPCSKETPSKNAYLRGSSKGDNPLQIFLWGLGKCNFLGGGAIYIFEGGAGCKEKVSSRSGGALCSCAWWARPPGFAVKRCQCPNRPWRRSPRWRRSPGEWNESERHHARHLQARGAHAQQGRNVRSTASPSDQVQQGTQRKKTDR